MATTLRTVLTLTIISVVLLCSSAQLRPGFYDEACPLAMSTIKLIVQSNILLEPRMGASLLRLHFHDCFVNGCDGSILLDDTPDMVGEKTAGANNNSMRGYDVIDQIKLAVDAVCFGSVVSCADIVAVAARDSVVALGGASYEVPLGRRDSTTASRDAANAALPAPFFDFSALLANFQSNGLSLQDLVVLSGAHTIGFARCLLYRNRIYNDTNIDSTFAASLQIDCPLSGDDDDNVNALDGSPLIVDTDYYTALMQEKGLLHSDQELFRGDGGASDELVKLYSERASTFWADFGVAMVNMGSISPLTGNDGVIRENCRVVAR